MQPAAADHDFREPVVRGLIRAWAVDIVRLRDVGRARDDDWDVLAWVAAQGRVLLTHDGRTMPATLTARVNAGLAVPRVILVSQRLPIGRAIEEVGYILATATDADWDGHVLYVPFVR